MNARFYRLPHYVYLLQGEGTNFFKIGLSRDVKRRAAAMQVPFDLVITKSFQTRDRFAAQAVEQGLHALYADRRIRGEWFRDIEIDQFISDAEYVSVDRADIARENYKKRNPVKKQPDRKEQSHDTRVLEMLKSKGYEAALKLREELNA